MDKNLILWIFISFMIGQNQARCETNIRLVPTRDQIRNFMDGATFAAKRRWEAYLNDRRLYGLALERQNQLVDEGKNINEIIDILEAEGLGRYLHVQAGLNGRAAAWTSNQMILFARDLGFRVTNGGRHGLHVTNGRVSIPIPKHGNGSLGNIAYKIKKQIERAAESISNGVQ